MTSTLDADEIPADPVSAFVVNLDEAKDFADAAVELANAFAPGMFPEDGGNWTEEDGGAEARALTRVVMATEGRGTISQRIDPYRPSPA